MGTMNITGVKWGWNEYFRIGTGEDKNIKILDVVM